MAKIKIKIEKKKKILSERRLPKIEYTPQPSMTDVKKEKKETVVPQPPKVIWLQKIERKRPKSFLLSLLVILMSIIILGLIIWFGTLAR